MFVYMITIRALPKLGRIVSFLPETVSFCYSLQWYKCDLVQNCALLNLRILFKVLKKSLNLIVKAAPWDDINFRFYFRTEVVYPTDHVFIFFRIFIFLKIFLINISM